MSTRKGTALFLEDILNEGKAEMRRQQTLRTTTKVGGGNEAETAADVVALSALFVYDLKRQKLRDYTFDWKDALHYKGNTGVRLQYTHCRLVSLEENSGLQLDLNADLSPILSHQTSLELAATIAK